MSDSIPLNTIEESLADFRAGKVIIVVDDEDRENEGDFICAAETVTPEVINFMATHGRGLICTPLEEKRADELGLGLMVSSNTALHETAFTVSIDLIGLGCTTGISAYDRATGIRHLTNPAARPSEYARPGHIFPLRAKAGGVLRRTGHTEATVDLARLAGLYPAGVLVEILNTDGSMARLPQLLEIARRHDLKIISIDDLVAYRMRTERLVRREMETTMETVHGTFDVVVFTDVASGTRTWCSKRANGHLTNQCWCGSIPGRRPVASSAACSPIMAARFPLHCGPSPRPDKGHSCICGRATRPICWPSSNSTSNW